MEYLFKGCLQEMVASLIKIIVKYKSNKLSQSAMLITFMSLILPLCAEATNDSRPSLSGILGNYKIVRVEQYGGGITTKKEANNRIGKKQLLLATKVSLLGIKISNPRYELEKVKSYSEGEVPTERLSSFYGIKNKQPTYGILNVFDISDQSSTPALSVEVSVNELRFLYDGWLYRLKKDNK